MWKLLTACVSTLNLMVVCSGIPIDIGMGISSDLGLSGDRSLIGQPIWGLTADWLLRFVELNVERGLISTERFHKIFLGPR